MSVTKSSIDDDIIISMEKFGASRIISIITAQQYKKKEKRLSISHFDLIGLFYKKYMTKNVTWKIVVLEKIFEKETPGNTNLTMYYDGSFKKLLQTMPKINFIGKIFFRSTFCHESFFSLRSRWA